MPNKFAIGDKVIIKKMDKRTPAYILESLRLDHPRKIVAIFYDNNAQHTRYYLGINKRGDVDLDIIHFRASQLRLWIRGELGRPKEKLRYKRNAPERLCNAKQERVHR